MENPANSQQSNPQDNILSSTPDIPTFGADQQVPNNDLNNNLSKIAQEFFRNGPDGQQMNINGQWASFFSKTTGRDITIPVYPNNAVVELGFKPKLLIFLTSFNADGPYEAITCTGYVCSNYHFYLGESWQYSKLRTYSGYGQVSVIKDSAGNVASATCTVTNTGFTLAFTPTYYNFRASSGIYTNPVGTNLFCIAIG
jgi:hypothetical protein